MTTIAEYLEAEGHKKGLEEDMMAGVLKGREEGKYEGIEETALRLIKMDMGMDVIMQATGLSQDQVLALKAKNNDH